MTSLLDLVLDARGGLHRWQDAKTIHAQGSIGGQLWSNHGQAGILSTADMIVEVQQERLVYQDYTGPELRGVFTPDNVAIERRDGEMLTERTSPRHSFADQAPNAPWDQLHVLYFAGYALWNYLTAPYLLAHSGVAVEEIEPWQEAGEQWRRLRATFPPHIATHAAQQTFYYNAEGLLQRHDYAADVLGGLPAAHLCKKRTRVSGLVFPTHRYVVPTDENGQVLSEPVLVTIDLTRISVT